MLFDNCIIQAPDGVNLSRCGIKKVRWYLQNGLADIVAENPTTIRLRFEPSGRTGVEDPLLMDGKPNICVVCGTPDNLTRHHIIPYSFIRHMQIEYKVDIIRDIFPCCEQCHGEYEKKSMEKRQEMADSFGVPLNGVDNDQMRKIRKATGAAVALKKHKDVIPESRKQQLLNFILDFTGKDKVSDEDLEELSNYRISERDDYVCFSKHVAELVNDYNEFAREWREHFVETMQPKFMPENWKTDRKTGTIWVPKRMQNQVKFQSLDSDKPQPFLHADQHLESNGQSWNPSQIAGKEFPNDKP
jgi:hypothetical protein